jgi:alanine racemase
MLQQVQRRPTEAHIDLDALEFNFLSSKKFIGSEISYMAVVKADAYGHGAAACAMRLESAGIDWFGVAIPEEGVELRGAGVRHPILCLGSFWPGQEGLLIKNHLTPVIFNLGTAERLDRLAAERRATVDVHIKVDTGMGRVGIPFTDAGRFAAAMKGFSALRINGLMTHFASADDPGQTDFTTLQISRFKAVCEEFRTAGFEPEWTDMANSPGAISHPLSRSNMVRLGGALYGLIDDILPPTVDRPDLRPVLSLKSRIADLRQVPAGESLGYGRTFTTGRESRIALVPIGYADGYPRALSNVGEALVRGQKARIAGRISMDWTLLDVTDIPEAEIGDDVLLIGSHPAGGSIRAADLARLTGTIGYEITCGISPRIPRIYHG